MSRELIIDGATCVKQLVQVRPIHAREVDRAIRGGLDQAFEHALQEGRELCLRHLTEAMTNSRCLVLPRPVTSPMLTL